MRTRSLAPLVLSFLTVPLLADTPNTRDGPSRTTRLGSRRDSPHDDYVQASALAFEPRGTRLAAGFFQPATNHPGTNWNTWVTLWNLQSGKRQTVARATAPILFSDDGKTLAMAVWERSREPGERMRPQKKMGLWRAGEQEPHRVLARGDEHDDSFAAATFAYGGLVTLTEGGEVILWEVYRDGPPISIGTVPRSGSPRFAPSLSYDPNGMGRIIVLVPVPVDGNGQSTRGRRAEDTHFLWVWTRTDGRRRKFKEVYRGEHVIGRPPFSRFGWPIGRSSPLTVPTAWLPQPAAALSSRGRPAALRQAFQCPGWSAIGDMGRVTLFSERDTTPTTLPFGGPVVAFDRMGSRLATANRRGIVRVWNLDERRIEKSLRLDDRPANTFRVAVVQATSRLGEPKENRVNLAHLVRRAASRGAKIVVLPETAVTGYMSQDLTKTWQVGTRPLSGGLTGVDPGSAAETVPGPSTRHFSTIALQEGIYITVPLLEVDRKARKYYNTVVLLDPAGRIALHYRKRNPWPWAERGWASEGTLGNPVLDTPFGRLGLLVCFDIHQQSKILADLKVDTLLYSIAWVEDAGSDWFDVRLPAIAKKNGFDIVGANWTVTPTTNAAGERVKPRWFGYGQSRIIRRDGTVLASVRDDLSEEVVYADLPLPRSEAP